VVRDETRRCDASSTSFGAAFDASTESGHPTTDDVSTRETRAATRETGVNVAGGCAGLYVGVRVDAGVLCAGG
jgi:hypothetical protein